MDKKHENRTLSEKLYNANVLPDGNLKSVNPIDVVLKRLENPPDKGNPTDVNEKNVEG